LCQGKFEMMGDLVWASISQRGENWDWLRP